MGYLEEFKTQIHQRDFSKFLQLWEEYCTNDQADVEELIHLLKLIKTSEFVKSFGKIVETILPQWQTIADSRSKYEVLKYLIDLETTNSPQLADLATNAIKEFYGNDPQLNERMKLVGLRSRENFQGAIASYELLAHMAPGKFVFHSGGWGTGEIVEVSQVREQIAIEFEFLPGRKHLTYSNAFKTLIPLKDDGFLARRFANPDLLEKEAKENSVEIVKLLLKDLGPKNAAEIKDELCELVIPEQDWTKWWQTTRAKLKKDPMIETPSNLRDAFYLRKAEITHEERLHKAIQGKTSADDLIQSSYNLIKDLPTNKNTQEVKDTIKQKLLDLFEDKDLTQTQELQIAILLETFLSHPLKNKSSTALIQQLQSLNAVVQNIEILALKKRVLVLVHDHRADWMDIFLSLLFETSASTLRDYILKELNASEYQPKLLQKLEELLKNPINHPDFFVWYFQKIITKSEESDNLPFSNYEGQCQLFESFLILMSQIDSKPQFKDLAKKMYNLLSGKRYAIVRAILQNTPLAYAQEFLLLASKCQSLSDHDLKILRSLVEVVHPSLGTKQKETNLIDQNTVWTTEQGYFKTQDRIRHIGTTEIVENAREIEAARALGDLRENSEYKFALERRSRLQAELKMLSEQLNKARIITKDDITLNHVGIGNILEIIDSKGKKSAYSILGPWDANPDENILSFQSKLAESMLGKKVGDHFRFKDEEYTIQSIKSFLN